MPRRNQKYGMPFRLPSGRLNPDWQHASYLAHKEAKTKRNKIWAAGHRARLRELKNTWNRSHIERVHEASRRRTLDLKKQAVLKTNGVLSCAAESCGCTDLSILQANYKAGGHSILTRKKLLKSGGLNLYRDIAWGRVDPNLFNFLCPPHNSIDHVPEIRGRFKILWIA